MEGGTLSLSSDSATVPIHECESQGHRSANGRKKQICVARKQPPRWKKHAGIITVKGSSAIALRRNQSYYSSQMTETDCGKPLRDVCKGRVFPLEQDRLRACLASFIASLWVERGRGLFSFLQAKLLRTSLQEDWRYPRMKAEICIVRRSVGWHRGNSNGELYRTVLCGRLCLLGISLSRFSPALLSRFFSLRFEETLVVTTLSSLCYARLWEI